jgi:uncharacterized protein (DUF1330 family)
VYRVLSLEHSSAPSPVSTTFVLFQALQRAGFAWLAILVLACSPVIAAPSGETTLDAFVRLQVGSFSSGVQARQDKRYDVAVWHIVEIWPQAAPGERWLYTESWLEGAPKPYLQRVSRVREDGAGAVRVQRYTLPEAERWVGAWQEPTRFAALERAQLTQLTGCDGVMVRTAAQRFEGGTVGAGCANAYKGARYAVSSALLGADEMVNWDRGFAADGSQVWGPADGGYRFRRVGEDNACVDPVRMLVYGEIRDRKAFGAYVRAIAEAGLYPKHGGGYEALTPALEVFEGSPPATRGVVIARFPCLAAAQAFWNSPEYAEIRKLREGIADFEVLVLPSAPVPRPSAAAVAPTRE